MWRDESSDHSPDRVQCFGLVGKECGTDPPRGGSLRCRMGVAKSSRSARSVVAATSNPWSDSSQRSQRCTKAATPTLVPGWLLNGRAAKCSTGVATASEALAQQNESYRRTKRKRAKAGCYG